MKKLLGIVVVSLLLSGCSGPSPFIPVNVNHDQYGGDLYVTEDPWAKSEYSEVVSVANNKCQSLGKGDAIMKPGNSVGLYIIHYFTCKKDNDITFTIKDKKDQCTAIGFEPATEKFADCVLKLVELDLKSQQATQIALAQSQGNQMVVDQLKEQNNSRSSDAFINLGTQLLNPQSNVSAPSTSTCRVIGSGAYKTVNCW